MSILTQITDYKRQVIKNAKQQQSIATLERSPFFNRTPVSVKQALISRKTPGVIAEFKRKSPSKSLINPTEDVKAIIEGYTNAGAAAISVLTDEHFFGGKNQYLQQARQYTETPLLRKDFMLDEYQVIEAKALGADMILLIASCLSYNEAKHLARTAKDLGMDVLFEIHDEAELLKLNEFVDLVGVNNRNLKTFATDPETSVKLAEKIPAEFVKISESGISDPEVVQHIYKYGYKGFLIGENFMATDNPGESCAHFINKLKMKG